jgi:hypothetical protein
MPPSGIHLHWRVAAFAVTLQLSFFVYSAWATFYHLGFYGDGELPEVWAFIVATQGTVLMVGGMVLCAFLIERKLNERYFHYFNPVNPASKPAKSTTWSTAVMSWLKTAGQTAWTKVLVS